MASGDASSGPSTRKQQKMNNGAGPTELDDKTRRIVKEISQCQDEIDELNEKAAAEVLDVERQYNKLRKPLFDQRAASIEKIPNFWSKAFTNHSFISDMLSGEQLECLKYLKKLEVEDEDIQSGYCIKFYFDENPFFENDVLVKQFHLGEPDATSSSSQIKWKDGVNFVQPPTESATKAKALLRARVPSTFFDWFLDNADPLEDQIASIIKDDIWVNPLEYCASDEDDSESGLDLIAEEDEDEGNDEEKARAA